MKKQRMLAVVLSLCMLITETPMTVLAAETTGDMNIVEETAIDVQEIAVERDGKEAPLTDGAEEELIVEDGKSGKTSEVLSEPDEYTEKTLDSVEASFSGNAILISTAAELASMSLSGNYILTDNIIVSDEWTPIGTDKNPFTGIFDGAGYTITINKVVASGVDDAGLFGNTKNAQIKNVDVNITITDARTAGGLVGYVHGGSITSCSAKGSITASQKNNSNVGGLLGGVSDNAVVTNCYASVDVTSNSDDYYDSCGGFVGSVNDDSTIRCCYATGTVSKPNHSNRRGGFVGFKGNDAQLFSCFFAESTKMSDVNAGFRIPNDEFKVADTFVGWDFNNVWALSSSVNGGYPYLSRVGEERKITMKSGSGLESDPYIIENEEQLLGFAWGANGSNNYSAYYKLNKDIELTSNYWTPIGGNGAPSFTGTFDGNGYKISGVNFNYNGYELEGLFGRTNKAVIKNVDIEANIAESTKAGALAAYVTSGEISACSSVGTINSNGSGYTEGGGLIGATDGSAVIRNCYSRANVNGESGDYYSGVGGLIGIFSGDSRLFTSYSTGKVTKPNHTNRVGGLVGYKGGDAFIADCFFSAGSECEDIQAGFMSNSRSMKNKDLYPYWDFTNVWDIDSNENSGFPYLKRSAEYKPVEPKGLGTKSSPYKISSAEELAAVARGEFGTNNYSGYYVLTNDITIPGKYWTPVAGNGSASFSGVFDGKGYAIKGLEISYTGYEWQGLFGYINKGTVKNLSVEVNITESSKAGGVTGHQESGEISSCSTTGSITSKLSGYCEVGGLVGSADGKYLIRNCYSRVDAAMSSSDYYSGIGGLVGILSGDGILTTSYAAGKAEKPNHTNRRGGLVGYKGADAHIADCFYDITVSERKEKSAGFGISTEKMKSAKPYVYWDFTNVWAMDESKNDGYPYHTYKKEYQPIELDGAGSTVEPYYITNEQELAAVARGESPKGFSGCYSLEEDFAISSEYWTPIGGNGAGVFSGEFDGQGHTISQVRILYAGYENEGLFGSTSGKISNLRVSGKISGTDTTAGLLTGCLTGTGVVECCAVLGSVEGTSELGGMIGYTKDGAKVSDCYSRADVLSASNDYYHGVGGLIGTANGKITLTNCYANGEISKVHTNNVSGLVGGAGDSAVVNNCYYSNYTGSNTKNRGTIKSNADMKLKDTFVDWDFSSTWSIASTENDGYPQLQIFAGKKIPEITDDVDVTGVSLNKEVLTIKIDDSETLTATVLPISATNKKITWKSSDETVATVTSGGIVQGIAVGTATITVTTEDGNKTAQCTVTVSESAAGTKEIALNKPSLSLAKGKEEALTVTFTPEDTTDKDLKWSSSDDTTASVNDAGKVTALKAGTATITVALASDETIKAECVVTVTDTEIQPTAIKLNKTKTSIAKDAIETLSVSFIPEGASAVDVVWSSNKENIAKVDQTGMVTGVSAGTAVITVASKVGTLSDSCTVTITDGSTPGPNPVPSETYDVSFFVGDSEVSNVTISSGDSIFDVMPDTADILGMIPDGGVFAGWYIDGTSTLWDITSPVTRKLDLEARYIVPEEEGTSTEQGSGRDPGLIKVVSASYYYDVYMVLGQSYTFPITYGDIDSTSTKKSEKINWVSSDTSTIKISSKYKAKASKVTGNNEIFVSDQSSIDASDYVYVIHIVSPELGLAGQVLPKTISLVKGETAQLTIGGIPEDSESYYDISWYSSNAEIARVDDGLVTAMGKGTAKVSAYVNGKIYTASIKVTDFKNPDKVKNESDIRLTLLQTASLKFNLSGFKAKGLVWTDDTDTLKAYDKSGLEVSAGDKKVSYYQNDVVRVTPAGKVTAVGIGNTTLTATDPNSKSVELTIDVPEPAESIIYVNKRKSKNLIYYNVNKKNAIFNYGSNESINLIDLDRKKGKVTGVSAGKAVVTCEADPYNTGNKIVYKTVIYVEDPVIDTADSKWSNKKPLSATLNLKKGEKFVIKVNGTWQPVVFTSNKNAIAFIDEAGVVEARSKGNATLSTRVNGAKLTVKVVVTE